MPPFVVAGVALVLLCVFTTVAINRLLVTSGSKPLSTKAVAAGAVVYLVAYLAAFSVSFTYGDARLEVPPALGVSVAILRFPMLYLGDALDPVLRAAGHWWGDDLNLILGFAVLNATLWGFAIAFTVRLLLVALRPNKSLERSRDA